MQNIRLPEINKGNLLSDIKKLDKKKTNQLREENLNCFLEIRKS